MHNPPHNGQRSAELKPRFNAFSERFIELLRRAVTEAAHEGISRQNIADGLGVSVHTLDAWMKPSRGSVAPSDRVFELVCREDILPQEVRDRFWAAAGAEGGYVVIPELEADPDEVPPVKHLLDVTGALGRLSDAVRQTMSRADDGRCVCDIDAARATDMLDHLHDLERHLAELRVSLEELMR